MNVAFVSRCQTYFSILAKALSDRYPNVSFTYFDNLQAFDAVDLKLFSHLIFKIYELPFKENYFTSLRVSNPHITTIGITLNSDFDQNKKTLGKLDYIFTDKDVDVKLNEYFFQKNHTVNAEDINQLEVDKKSLIYIHLPPNLSTCLFHISENKTAKEISQILNRSPRTIEKYIEDLKKTFDLKSKKELSLFYKNLSSSVKNKQ